MAKVILFGIKDYAELAHYYLQTDSEHEVLGFTLHEAFMPEQAVFKGLPIFPFETLPERFSPSQVKLFAPMSPAKMNRRRRAVYEQIKHMGYEMISYVSSRATVLTEHIGDNCFILEDNTIQPFTKIGNNVVLWSGNLVSHHSVIEDHVTLTCQTVVAGHCIIGEQSFLGINASIRNGVKVGKSCLIGMGAALAKDATAGGVYLGVPAKRQSNKKAEDLL